MPVLRHMTNADLLAYKHLCSICYLYQDTDPAEEQPEEKLWQKVGVFAEDGTLLSAMTQIDYTARFEGQDMKLLGIGGVVSDPVARGQRGVRQMFEEGLPRLRDAGYVFSALYPFSHQFYRKFGYEMGGVRREAVFAPSRLRRDLYCAEEILRVLPGEDDRGMEQVYAQYAADKNFAIRRTAEMWNDMRRGTPWDSLKHAYVLRDKGEPIAFWVGQAERGADGSKTLVIRHMAYVGRKGCEAIFAMLRGYNEFGKVRLQVPDEIEMRFLLEDPHDLESEWISGGGMIRIMDVERALAMLKAPALPGRLVVEVADGQIPQNNGRFLVEGDGYALSVSRVEDMTADLRCTINGLTALVVGIQEFEDGIRAGHGEVLSEKNLRFMSALLHQRKYYLNWAF